jgi:hypothetical protein
MNLMPADLAAWPNELVRVSAPCNLCHKQVDIPMRVIASMKEFRELEDDIRQEATDNCKECR